MPDRRRAGLLVLLLVLAGALPLVVPPFDLGAVRLAGVSLLWWYVGAVAPVVAAVTTAIALGPPLGRRAKRDDEAVTGPKRDDENVAETVTPRDAGLDEPERLRGAAFATAVSAPDPR